MCTVTIVPLAGGFRLASNRDESRSRPAATPPSVWRQDTATDPVRALQPTDAEAGGTWIAVNTAGLAFTLLNANPPGLAPHERPRGRLSRGSLITRLLDCATLDDTASRLAEEAADGYAPFRLVATDGDRLVVAAGDQNAIAIRRESRGDKPRFFTSSGLGDHLVEPPRRALFDTWFSGDRDAWPDRQDAFHRHRWPDRPELSVCMSRDDATTVSLTVAEVRPGVVRMLYHPGPPCEPADEQSLELRR